MLFVLVLGLQVELSSYTAEVRFKPTMSPEANFVGGAPASAREVIVLGEVAFLVLRDRVLAPRFPLPLPPLRGLLPIENLFESE